MRLKEIYSEMTSDYLFEIIAQKYDIFILVNMHISIPFFAIKHHTVNTFHENL
jgi:hypothetical protein